MSSLDDDLLQELLRTFRAEAADHLQTINQSILKLERVPDETLRATILQDAFRSAHSLKGAARAVGQEEIEMLAHGLESVFQQARDAGLALTPEICDVLYDSLDMIEQLLRGQQVDISPLHMRLTHTVNGDVHSAPPKPAPVVDESQPPTTAASGETIRVSIHKLDDLMAQVGELLVAKISTDQRLVDADAVSQRLEQWMKSWRDIQTQMGDQMDGRLAQAFARHTEQTSGLIEVFRQLDEGIARDAVRLGIVTTNLQDRVRSVRMIPFQTLVFSLERAVRDAARSEQKSVRFSVDGGHVELDKKVLEALKDPLLHLVRNAVAHGIEPAAARSAAGKPADGHIRVELLQRGSEVHLLVCDDGRGFDVAALREAYVKRTGHQPDEHTGVSDLTSLAFLPGVTTAPEVTSIAGRGVGLDVVRQALGSIQGRISVSSVPGEGTTIHLVVPTSLAMMRGLLVQVGEEKYALPLLSIEKIVEPESVFTVAGRRMIRVDAHPLPVVSLAQLLQRAVLDGTNDPLALILNVADQRLALLVDDVLTEQELAVKSLGYPLNQVPNVIGAALLGSGEPLVILNPADLVNAAQQVRSDDVPVQLKQAAPREVQPVHVLVVDDSITTRTLEKSILEAAGYRVTTATHGKEALKRLADWDDIRMIVADVEMPQMDGIALVKSVRRSPNFRRLPIILVTSLESKADRERGMAAGANAYIIKRGFDQAELLTTVQQLL
ncbi:MAG: hypothetical protein CL610_10645 [Anaerolineaceae bacterium]|nr:hypothetical protein [Anaerolineaceae bacterium]